MPNESWIKQWRPFFEWLEANKILVVIANAVLWPYYFWGILGWASLSLILLVLWLLGKSLLWASIKLKERKEKAILGTSGIAQKLIKIKKSFIIESITLKIFYIILTYVLLIGFLIGILFYNAQLISEGTLQMLAVISSVFFIGLSITNFEEEDAIKTFLHHWSERPIFDKIKSLLRLYWEGVDRLNINCFPWVALVAFWITLLFSIQMFPLDIFLKFFLLYFMSIGLLLIHHHTVNEKMGFLLWRSRGGLLFKVGLEIAIPLYLFFQLIMMREEVFLGIRGMALLVGVGALGLIFSDPFYRLAYRSVNFPILRKTFLKYSLAIAIIFLAYGGALYSYRYISQNSVTPAVFADVEQTHWAYPAMVRLVENGSIAPDADHFLHPARFLTFHAMLSILFNDFGIKPEHYKQEPEIDFVYISNLDEEYPVFKAAFYLGLVNRFSRVNEFVSKKEALRTIGVLKHWPLDWPLDSGDPVRYAFKAGVITSEAPESLNQVVSRSVLAQMLYKTYLNEKIK